jgi:hypothetical protein
LQTGGIGTQSYCKLNFIYIAVNSLFQRLYKINYLE